MATTPRQARHHAARVPGRRGVVALIVLAALVPGRGAGAAADPCQSTDGPQFRCWLYELPATR